LYGSKEATLFALFNNPDKFMVLLSQTWLDIRFRLYCINSS
jgi:hypothetical protein